MICATDIEHSWLTDHTYSIISGNRIDWTRLCTYWGMFCTSFVSSIRIRDASQYHRMFLCSVIFVLVCAFCGQNDLCLFSNDCISELIIDGISGFVSRVAIIYIGILPLRIQRDVCGTFNKFCLCLKSKCCKFKSRIALYIYVLKNLFLKCPVFLVESPAFPRKCPVFL
jgi:hypothetical protein